MKQPYYMLPQSLPDMITDDIKKIALNYEETDGAVGGLPGIQLPNVDMEVRRVKQRWLPINFEETKKIHTLCTEIFEEANRRCFGVDITKIFEMFYGEYHGDDKGFYREHRDSSLGSNGDLHDRKLSLTIQLSNSDEYEGGDFVFYDNAFEHPDKEALRQKGMAFVFPSFLLHGVQPVTKGTRKCLVAFMEGPAWQ